MSLRVGFEVPKDKARTTMTLLPAADLVIELPATFLAPCLPMCHRAQYHETNGLIL